MQKALFKNKNPMAKMFIAWDLDGTLVDSSHRFRLLENGDFDLNYWIENSTYEKISQDKILPLHSLYMEYKKTGFTQICVTARAINEHDIRMLKENGMEFDIILHRKDSMELDQVLKDRKLQEYFEDNDMIPFMAFDDKDENLEIFDKHSFRTFQAVYMNKKLAVDSYKEITFGPKDK